MLIHMTLNKIIMTIENDIKQVKPFPSELEKCVVNIMYTNNLITLYQHNWVKEFDISLEQYNVLRILKGQNYQPITINEIIDRMLNKMSNASRLVDKLYEKGLVNRKQRKTNRRACDVTITKKGEDLLEAINFSSYGMLKENNSLKDLDLTELSSLLDRLRENMKWNI